MAVSSLPADQLYHAFDPAELDFETTREITPLEEPVVIPCDAENLEEEQLCALVDEISNPVMLIR